MSPWTEILWIKTRTALAAANASDARKHQRNSIKICGYGLIAYPLQVPRTCTNDIDVRLQEHSAAVATDSEDDMVIIYNRVPKTGSTSFVGIAYQLYAKNNYHVLHFNISRNKHVLSIVDQVYCSHACQLLVWS